MISPWRISKRNIDGFAQVFYERSAGPTQLGVNGQKVLALDLSLGKLRKGYKIFSLEIVDQRVVGIITLWRPFQTIPAESELIVYLFALGDALPCRRVLDHEVSDFAQGGPVWMIYANPSKTGAGFDMEIETGRMYIAALFVAKLNSYRRLVGALVF